MKNKCKTDLSRNHPIKEIAVGRSWLFDFLNHRKTQSEPRIFKENKFSDLIFRSCIHDDPDFQSCITEKSGLYPSMPELANDVFTALFSVAPERNDHPLTDRASSANLPIIDALVNEPKYGDLSALCQDKELPAYHACAAFCENLTARMEEIQVNEYQYLAVDELLNQQIMDLIQQLTAEYLGLASYTEKATLKMINRLKDKLDQLLNLQLKLEQGTAPYTVQVRDHVSVAIDAALEAAQDTSNMLMAWGFDDGTMKSTPQNRELLEHIKNSKALFDVAKLLGKYRDMMNQKRKNSFRYGGGEKYDLSHGNDLDNCLSSELALLAHPDTQALFLRKFQRKQLLQYRKRQPTTKGEGDIIVLIDESGSTEKVQSWSKALAFALLDIAAKGKRRFALLHFASADQIKTDIFDPGKYTPEDVMAAAEHFFDGGTDFEAPLSEALRLMDNGFEDADITIITDGECSISENFATTFEEQKQLHRMTMTGILLDAGRECGEPLLPFCDVVYHARDFAEDEIAMRLLESKV